MSRFNRRQLIRDTGLLAGAAALGGLSRAQGHAFSKAPTAPVSLERCRTYDLPAVLRSLEPSFDRVGGIRKLVRGRTVAVKVN